MKNVILFRPRISEKAEWYKIPLELLALARMITNYKIKMEGLFKKYKLPKILWKIFGLAEVIILAEKK